MHCADFFSDSQSFVYHLSVLPGGQLAFSIGKKNIIQSSRKIEENILSS
jgi:hypothetical protein